jgi:predicted nucleic acid-binding protein
MTPVFLDTVGLLALWVVSDQWHADAEAAFSRLLASRRPYLTTSFVLLECGNAAARRPYRTDVINLRRELLAKGGLIVPTNQDWNDAWAEYDRGRPGDAGIVDCISFVVMRRLGLTEAFTNDQHFTAVGFTNLF